MLLSQLESIAPASRKRASSGVVSKALKTLLECVNQLLLVMHASYAGESSLDPTQCVDGPPCL